MLNKLRGFSNSKLAMVVVGIIIIPFVFWGMGSVFSGGNTNNVAKINNETISTKDFVDHINQSRLTNEIIKENIDNDILEEILKEVVSQKLVDMEISELNVSMSEISLADKIKSNNNFLDDKKNFSRIKYEKFLLQNNISAPIFEARLKKQELKRKLFNYISGGVKSPYFLKNKLFISEQKEVVIDYLDLNLIYSNEASISEINDFVKENEELLKEDFIDFSYAKISPKDLVEIDEFNDEFFKKIDEIENNILNGNGINEIKKNYNLKVNSYSNFKTNDNSDEILKMIYSNRSGDKIKLVDKNEYFVLYEIFKLNKISPDKSNKEFIKMVKNGVILKKKYKLHEELYKRIDEKKLDDSEFIKIAKKKENIQSFTIKNIDDSNIFDIESVKLIYSLPKKSFTLITGKENKIFLAKIKNINFKNLDKSDKKNKEYLKKTNNNIISDIHNSYNSSLNSKYKVKIFQTTLDRVKNYFR